MRHWVCHHFYSNSLTIIPTSNYESSSGFRFKFIPSCLHLLPYVRLQVQFLNQKNIYNHGQAILAIWEVCKLRVCLALPLSIYSNLIE